MIFGRLNTQGSQLSKFLGQKPIWQLCFNWLKNLPKELPLGRHELDYSIVTAVHSEIKIGDLNHDLLYCNRSLVEIHYIVDGFQKIQLGYAGEELLSEGFNGGEINAESVTASVTMRHSDFLVVFPGEFYQFTGPLVGHPLLKKIVISIPIQRFI